MSREIGSKFRTMLQRKPMIKYYSLKFLMVGPIVTKENIQGRVNYPVSF